MRLNIVGYFMNPDDGIIFGSGCTGVVFVFAWAYHFSDMHSDFAAAKFVQFAGMPAFAILCGRLCYVYA